MPHEFPGTFDGVIWNLLLVSLLILPFFLIWGTKRLRRLSLGVVAVLTLLNGLDSVAIYVGALPHAPLVVFGLLVFGAIVATRRRRATRPVLNTEGADLLRAAYIAGRGSQTVREQGAPVEEAETVVLRRQIPVRFDEPPRSWLGGCPMMPEHVPWPTSPSAEVPDGGDFYLHFVAQIACADLPAGLWGGLGPRSGWLLLFLDGQDPAIEPYPSTLQVIHVDELGPERHPPHGTRPVSNEEYNGYPHGYYARADDAPVLWRRWPVDILSFPNELGRTLPKDVPAGEPADASTPVTEATPYGGEMVDRRRFRDYVAEVPNSEEDWPFTWRGALYVVDSAIRAVASRRPVELGPRDRERFEDPSWAETQIPHLQQLRDAASKGVANGESQLGAAGDSKAREEAQELLEYWREQLAQTSESLQLFEEFRGAEGLISLRARVEASMKAYNEWWPARLPDLQALRESILAHDLDSAMSAVEFRPIFERLADTRTGYLGVISGGSHGDIVRTIEWSLAESAKRGFSAARGEVAAELYVKSPDARALIPKALLERCEPKWRYQPRSHRMGGWHDGIQSDASGAPSDTVLLFQISCDDAMEWSWGDHGAYYVFIRGSDLADGRFDRIEFWHEN